MKQTISSLRYRCIRPTQHARRRGSVYILVLSVASLLTVIGLTAVHVSRVQNQSARSGGDWQEASALASSGIELALTKMATTPAWRTALASGTIYGPITLGRGTFEWKIVDEVDGDLVDDNTDPVRVYATGRVGDAVRILSVQAKPVQVPMSALQTCVHSATGMQITSGDYVRPIGAPASTNGNVQIAGRIYGNVAAATISGNGFATGQTSVPSAAKALPPAGVFASYVAKARALPFNGDIDTKVIAPGVNEYGGGTNADGLYYINTGGNNITIEDSRILGTLVIDATGKTVTIDSQVLMERYRQDYPLLIVKGNLLVTADTRHWGFPLHLMEATLHHNFNPPGAPYLGATDSTHLGVYSSAIRGLIHVIGDVTFNGETVVHGTVISEGFAYFKQDTDIIFDETILTNPPQGYTSSSSTTTVDPTTWRWDVNP